MIDISDLNNKQENSGATANGRISASDWNRTVSAIIESQNTLGTKADSSNVYSKVQVDTLVANKANTNDVYTKATIDTKLATKANSDDVQDLVSGLESEIEQKADLNGDNSVAFNAQSLTASEIHSNDYVISGANGEADMYYNSSDNTIRFSNGGQDMVLPITPNTTIATQSYTYPKETIDNMVGVKADQATTYTKAEVDEQVDAIDYTIYGVRQDVTALQSTVGTKANMNGSYTEMFKAQSLEIGSGGSWKIEETSPNTFRVRHQGTGHNFTFAASADSFVLPDSFVLSSTFNTFQGNVYTKSQTDTIADNAKMEALRSIWACPYNLDSSGHAISLANGAPHYNATTGYWELNGLNDITDDEMAVIYAITGNYQPLNIDHHGEFYRTYIRTNIVRQSTWAATDSNYASDCRQMFYGCPNLEVVFVASKPSSSSTAGLSVANAGGMFQGSSSLRTIKGNIWLTYCTNTNNMFADCTALETVTIRGLKLSISFADCASLTNASVLNAVQYSQATSDIVVVLHPDVFTSANQDADIRAALQSHPYVSLQTTVNGDTISIDKETVDSRGYWDGSAWVQRGSLSQ